MGDIIQMRSASHTDVFFEDIISVITETPFYAGRLLECYPSMSWSLAMRNLLGRIRRNASKLLEQGAVTQEYWDRLEQDSKVVSAMLPNDGRTEPHNVHVIFREIFHLAPYEDEIY